VDWQISKVTLAHKCFEGIHIQLVEFLKHYKVWAMLAKPVLHHLGHVCMEN